MLTIGVRTSRRWPLSDPFLTRKLASGAPPDDGRPAPVAARGAAGMAVTVSAHFRGAAAGGFVGRPPGGARAGFGGAAERPGTSPPGLSPSPRRERAPA